MLFKTSLDFALNLLSPPTQFFYLLGNNFCVLSEFDSIRNLRWSLRQYLCSRHFWLQVQQLFLTFNIAVVPRLQSERHVQVPKVHGVQASSLASSSRNKSQLVYADNGDPMVPVIFSVTGEQGVWAWGAITDEGGVGMGRNY